jgi:hypothetical protein
MKTRPRLGHLLPRKTVCGNRARFDLALLSIVPLPVSSAAWLPDSLRRLSGQNERCRRPTVNSCGRIGRSPAASVCRAATKAPVGDLP